VRTFTGSEIVIELALLLQTWKLLNPPVDTPSGNEMGILGRIRAAQGDFKGGGCGASSPA
jgi:hypothetical protein